MKDKNIIGFHIALILFVVIVFCISSFNTKYCTEKLQDKIEELKPKETKTVEDYHNLIEDAKGKIDEIASDKWLKVSDIKEKFRLISDFYAIDVEVWRELLKKAEDAPVLLFPRTETYHSMIDVSIGVTAEQIVEAFKSIDPNSLIRHKKNKPADMIIEF